MVHTVPSAVLVGLEAHPVAVEVSIRRGTPMIQIVGLAPASARESRERFRAAAAQLGLRVPGLRITVNLAPADIRKDGPSFDLPIAVGILAAAGQVPPGRSGRFAMVGELGLDGSVRSVRGVLPIALRCHSERRLEGLIVPLDNLAETRPVTKPRIYGAATLREVLTFLRGTGRLPRRGATGARSGSGDVAGASRPDLSDVLGQRAGKRALEVAAAGGHNLLLRGQPGCGKTMLARRLPTLLPEMTMREAIEATTIHSVAGRLSGGLLVRRPFRAPHHSITEAGLVGSGSPPRPGEVSLAHCGVLLLDEFPEFRLRALEALREPVESGHVTIVRARSAVRFPSRFMLVAAMNPCPCGMRTDREDRCTCDPATVRRYHSRVGGPLLDRIDMHVDLPAVPWRELRKEPAGHSSDTVRSRVREARRRARRRFGPRSRHATNSCLAVAQLGDHCRLDERGEALLRVSAERFGLSARACHRILRVSRTIADLAGSDEIRADHVAEAARYRVPSLP